MGFTHTHIWTGTRLTVGDLRTLAAWTEGMSTTEPVEVRVEQPGLIGSLETIVIEITTSEGAEA